MRAVVLAALLVASSGCDARGVTIEAHRGDGVSKRDGPPENTLPAFHAGIEARADVLEMDAHLLTDGRLAIVHDDTLDRTTDAAGCVNARTAADLARIDAGKGSSWEGRGARPPTLDEVLSEMAGPLNVELKRESGAPCAEPSAEALSRAMVDALDRAKARRRVLVSSFDRDTLRAMHALAPEVPLALLSTTRVSVNEAQKLGVRAVQIAEGAIDASQIETCHAGGLEVHAWTVDDPRAAQRLVDLGVDRLITNDPVGLRMTIAARPKFPRGIVRALAVLALLGGFAWLSRKRNVRTS